MGIANKRSPDLDYATDSVSVEVANDAVTFAGIDCWVIWRNWPEPVDVVLTPRLKVLADAPAEVRTPAHEPAVVGSVPPNLEVTTHEVALAGTSAAESTVSTPGEADVQVNGTHLLLPM